MARTPKAVEEAKANFEAAIVYIPERYRKGIERARWEPFATSDQAEKNYSDAMSKVLAEGRRKKGCMGKETKWKDGAINKGAPVIAERIRMGLGNYEANFGRVYNAVLADIKALPPRTIDPMANIDNRLKPVVRSWIKNKIKGK